MIKSLTQAEREALYSAAPWLDDYYVGLRPPEGWRSFKKARAFVQTLRLKNNREWRMCKKPRDIPANPDRIYKTQGWVNWGDWLGYTPLIPTDGWRPFKKARIFVQSLNLKNVQDWNKYCKSDSKPKDIPSAPWAVYRGQGWNSTADWLGKQPRTPAGGWRPFKKARIFVRSLGLKSKGEYETYRQSGKKPMDIPSTPELVYKKRGWDGWGDWLGAHNHYGTPSTGWLPFKKARSLARSLSLKNNREWQQYCLSGKTRLDLPNRPDSVYDEWVSWSDWLNTKNVGHHDYHRYRSFKAARVFSRSLKLKSVSEWGAFAKSERRPKDIPACPQGAYEDKGWISAADWLGYTSIRSRKYGFSTKRGWRSFKKARTFTRSLGLKTYNAWRSYSKSQKKPDDIPTDPLSVYKNHGWVSWVDWMGYTNLRKGQP